MTSRLLGPAAIALVGFAALGWWVTHHPPAPIDSAGGAIVGSNLPLAIVLTDSGYPLALGVLGLAGVVIAALAGVSVRLPLAILASQILSQGAVSALKLAFARPRPTWWVHYREAGLSYPSGHATTAIVFYGAWLLVVWFAPLPLLIRLAGCTLIGMWIGGIGWSRLALGAHYPTDVLGGYVFGVAWLCAAIVLARSSALHILLPASSGSPIPRS